MDYSKLSYALLNLKTVLIFTYFDVMIYIEFELHNYFLMYLVTYIFLINVFYFLASAHIFRLSALERYFLISFELNSLKLVTQLEHKATLTLPKGTTIYKTLIFALDFPHYNHIYK
jgi:hypothetical protein